MTFRGPAEKCVFEPLFYENFVFAVQRGPRIAPNFMFFRKALPEAHFSGPEGPECPPRRISVDFGAILGSRLALFSALFGTFWGVGIPIDFDRFSEHFWQGPAAVAGSAEAHSESADTEDTEGLRKKFHHALHPEGVRRILRVPPPAAGPLELF